MSKSISYFIFGLLVLGIAPMFGFAQEASATQITLTDENAVVVIEDGAGGSNAGVMSYTVDGVDHMTQEAWWFSTGSALEPQSNAEVPFASLGVDSSVATDEDSDGDNDKLVINFGPPNPSCIDFELTFELTGGAPGSGTANLKETLTAGGPCTGLFLNSFQYTNYDAEGSSINTSLRTATNTVGQGVSGPPFATTTTYSKFDGASLQPNLGLELGLASDLLVRLDDGIAIDIVDTAVGSGFGPGDGAFVAGFQNSLDPLFGGPVFLVIDKEILPLEVLVPNVVGKSQSDAIDDIRAAPLIGGAITHAASDTVPVGNIISQNPPAGTPVSTGTPVDLEISVGSGNLFKLSFTAFLTFFQDPFNLIPPFTSVSGYYIYDADSVDGNIDPNIGEYSYRASNFALDDFVFVGTGPSDPLCSTKCIQVIVLTPEFGQFFLESSTIQIGGPFLNIDPGFFLIPLEDLDSGIFSTDALPTTPFNIQDIEFLQFESHFIYKSDLNQIEMVGLFDFFDLAPLVPPAQDPIIVPVPIGQNVNVQVPNPAPGINSISFEFDEVTQAGNLTIDTNQTCPPNMGFQIVGLGGAPACLSIDFDGSFTGNVVIMINYDDTGLTTPQELSLTLFHFDDITMLWENITDNVDTVQNILTGTTDGFSFFGIFTPAAAPIGGTLIPIDTTALLLASVQSISMWMIPVVVAGIAIGVFVIKRRK